LIWLASIGTVFLGSSWAGAAELGNPQPTTEAGIVMAVVTGPRVAEFGPAFDLP
jgi:hypothetical protein